MVARTVLNDKARPSDPTLRHNDSSDQLALRGRFPLEDFALIERRNRLDIRRDLRFISTYALFFSAAQPRCFRTSIKHPIFVFRKLPSALACASS